MDYGEYGVVIDGILDGILDYGEYGVVIDGILDWILDYRVWIMENME
jgi:hypothetical protein